MTDIKPGDRVKCGNRKGTVLGVNKAFAWVLLDGDDNPYTYRLSDLTLIPPKIAEPEIGEVVWDFYEPAGKRIPFTHLAPAGKAWSAFVNGQWYNLHWSDFSDDVTLAVDPKAGA